MKSSKAKKARERSERAGLAFDSLDNQGNEFIAISKLLEMAAELMNRTPGIDKEAFEYLRRLRVKIRYTTSAGLPTTWNVAPVKAPKKWSERERKKETPVDFIQREYAPWLERKNISRADIRRLDRQLYTALYNWIAKHGEIDAIIDLPTLSEANQRKLEAIGGKIKAPSRLRRASELSLEERERLRLYKLVHRRKEPRTK